MVYQIGLGLQKDTNFIDQCQSMSLMSKVCLFVSWVGVGTDCPVPPLPDESNPYLQSS